jgi:hypothetical protein
MGGYWTRARERYTGNIFSIDQWILWPPFFHILIANFFKPLALLGLFEHKLELFLSFNVLLSSVGVYALYFLAWEVIEDKTAATTIAGLYAFSIPLIYFNAFVLTENLAVPLLIVCLALIVCRDGYFFQSISAVLFGITVAVRPGFGILLCPILGFMLLREMSFSLRFKQSLIFTLIFFLVIGGVIVEVNHISGGRVTGLSASGGLNFYLGKKRLKKIVSKFDGFKYVIGPPSTQDNLMAGVEVTNVPFYNDEHFYRKGFEYIRENPSILLEKVFHQWDLFFGPLLPSSPSAFGFEYWYKPSQWLYFLMFLTLGLSYLPIKETPEFRLEYIFLLSIPFFFLFLFYWFTVEHRYLYQFAFVLYVLTWEILRSLFQNFHEFKYYLFAYLGLIASSQLVYYLMYYSEV